MCMMYLNLTWPHWHDSYSTLITVPMRQRLDKLWNEFKEELDVSHSFETQAPLSLQRCSPHYRVRALRRYTRQDTEGKRKRFLTWLNNPCSHAPNVSKML